MNFDKAETCRTTSRSSRSSFNRNPRRYPFRLKPRTASAGLICSSLAAMSDLSMRRDVKLARDIDLRRHLCYNSR